MFSSIKANAWDNFDWSENMGGYVFRSLRLCFNFGLIWSRIDLIGEGHRRPSVGWRLGLGGCSTTPETMGCGAFL